MKFLIRLIYGIPKYQNNVWWNRSCYTDEKYPIIFDSEKRYIFCSEGLKVMMGKTKSGKDIYYEVASVYKTPGSDWLSPSDAISCNLKFSHVSMSNVCLNVKN